MRESRCNRYSWIAEGLKVDPLRNLSHYVEYFLFTKAPDQDRLAAEKLVTRGEVWRNRSWSSLIR